MRCIQIYFLWALFALCSSSQAHANTLDSLLNQLSLYSDSTSLSGLDQKSILCNDIAVSYQGLAKTNKARTYFLKSIDFARERIEREGDWNAQNNYDMGSLYSNLAIFESTQLNFELAQKHLNQAEEYFVRLKSQIPREEYAPLIIRFYETSFTLCYHNEAFDEGMRYLDKAKRLALKTKNPQAFLPDIYRFESEVYAQLKDYERSEEVVMKAFDILEKEPDFVMRKQYYLHTLIASLYHGDKMQQMIDVLTVFEEYQTVDNMRAFAKEHQDRYLSDFLENIFILSFAYSAVYDAQGNVENLKRAFEIELYGFELVEELILKNEADRLNNIIYNGKNKVVAVLMNAIRMIGEGLGNEVDVIEILRIIDLYNSSKLQLERINFTLNSDLWEQQKETQNELSFVNLKLEEAVANDTVRTVIDSLKERSYKLSLELIKLEQKTKKGKLLDEYQTDKKEYKKRIQNYVEETNKTILTYFYESGQDTVYILGLNRDTAFIEPVTVDTNFTELISDVYDLNAHFLTDGTALKEQEKGNKKLYQKCYEPLVKQDLTENLLIYPIDEMSYISYEALLSPEDAYLFHDHFFSYTTSLYGVIQDHVEKDSAAQVYSFYPSQYGTDSLAYLAHAQKEVDAISTLLSGECLKGKLATKLAFIQSASSAKLMHLASHSILNFENPYESYVIFQHESDSSENRLFAYEIFSMTMDADLVTLSSCNSAKGDLEQGIGVVSLSNAFFYAGVPSTVSSLWSAQDRSSAQIMETFYAELKKGKSKSESIHAAKNMYLDNADKITSQPFFWANYVMYGSDSPIFKIPSEGSSGFLWWIIGGVSVFFIGFITYRIYAS